MADILEKKPNKKLLILTENLNSGLNYLITTVLSGNAVLNDIFW